MRNSFLSLGTMTEKSFITREKKKSEGKVDERRRRSGGVMVVTAW